MTNKRASEILYHQWQSFLEKNLDYGGVSEAYKKAFKALQQESILDKISTEINNYGSIWVRYKIIGHTDQDIKNIVENVLKQAKEQVLDIIDKYKAESEG